MKMTNETYNKIKWIVMILLPALTSLVGGLGKAYGWDGTELAVTTLTLFTTFLGAITVKAPIIIMQKIALIKMIKKIISSKGEISDVY